MDILKQAIINIVLNKQGCKATELPVEIAVEHPELLSQLDNVIEVLDELVEEGNLVEVEYVLPNMNYRIKSVYFPKGTQIVVRNGGKQ